MEGKQKNEKADLYIKWLHTLMAGRAKPDRNGQHPFIRESVEYIGLIDRINKEVEELLDLPSWEEFGKK